MGQGGEGGEHQAGIIVRWHQQQSHSKSSGTAIAPFIQRGGRSSSITSPTGLNTLVVVPPLAAPERDDGLERRAAGHARRQPRRPGSRPHRQAQTASRVQSRTRSSASRCSRAFVDEAKHGGALRMHRRRTVRHHRGRTCPWLKKCWRRCEPGRARPRSANIRCRTCRPTRALMKMEVAGICGTDVKLYAAPAERQAHHHGPREHRLLSPRPAASSPAARASRKATSSSSSTT